MSVPVPTLEEKIQFLDDFMIPSFEDEECPDQSVRGRKQWIRDVRANEKTLPAAPLLKELFGLYGSSSTRGEVVTSQQLLIDQKNLLLRQQQQGK